MNPVWAGHPRALFALALAALAAPATPAAQILPEPAPTSEIKLPAPDAVFQTGLGRFEIRAKETPAIRTALGVAEEVWTTLATPLDLPREGFPSAITVRLVPTEEWPGEAPFQSSAKPGEPVTVWVRWPANAEEPAALRRALTQALLMRRAIAFHGLVDGLKVPLWLEDACTGWSLVRARPAMLDSWQQESALTPPPPLAAVLARTRTLAPLRAAELAAPWLMGHLQAEPSSGQGWLALVRAVLGGMDSAQAVRQFYGHLFNDDTTRELWWQVGYHSQRRLSLPAAGLSAADSRLWLAERARWTGTRAGVEAVLALEEIFALRKEKWVQAELDSRLALIKAGLITAHVFYRNAAVSLGRVYETIKAGNQQAFSAAETILLRDIADGRELEDATKEALDALSATAPDTGEKTN